MKKLFKKTRKLRKKMYGGNVVKNNGSNNTNNNSNNNSKNNDTKHSPKGVFDIVGEKVSGFAENTGSYLKNKGLRLFGLQPIKPDLNQVNEPIQVNQTINNISGSASSMVADVANVVNKSSAAIIENVNEVLGSPQVNEDVSQAAEKTEAIAEDLLETFNEKLSSPEVKEELTETLNNVADYAEIGIQAMNKPIDSAIDKLNESGVKAISGVASGAVKVGTDLLASVPYVGAVVDLGKAINDGSKAVSSVIESGSQATEAVAELIGDTSENLKQGIEELKEKKMEGEKIMNRANSSISDFENPTKKFSESLPTPTLPSGKNYIKNNTNGILKGGNTKKRVKKHKHKSKRVRFLDY
uniref:Uncharacterized protein n=1 Tax=viral metagenome TaxID=1070528 RepID=A0A6C0ES81_9ZZZZ